MKKGITAFYPPLLKDTAWQTIYLENDVVASVENLYLLLRHFKDTSLKSGTTYDNLMEVKRHFANWHQINQSKKALGQFLQEGKKAVNGRKRKTPAQRAVFEQSAGKREYRKPDS